MELLVLPTANHGNVAPEEFLTAIAQHVAGRVIDNANTAGLINFHHGVQRGIDHGLRQVLTFLEFGLVLLECRQILDKATEKALTRGRVANFLHAQFAGKFTAVLASTTDFAAGANNVAHATGDIRVNVARVMRRVSATTQDG